MTLLSFLFALLFQMTPTETGNEWTVQILQHTLANLHTIQGFFGWVALIALILILVLMGTSMASGKGIVEAFGASGCLGIIAVVSIVLWLVGFLHLWVVEYLANNYSLAGATTPGFWVMLVLMVIFSWS